MPILYILYIILLTILAWRRLNWAALLIIFALPSYLIRFSVGSVHMTLLEVMVLIVFIVWAIKRLKIKNYGLRITNLLILVGLFFLAATISVFVSPNLRAALGVWKAYFLEPILFFIVVKDLLVKTNDQITETENLKFKIKNLLTIPQIVVALSLSALILSVFAIYQKFTGFWIPAPWAAAAGRRVTSLFEYPNALGLFLGPLVPLFVGQIFSKKNLLAICYWLLAIGLSLLAIIWAHSTGALVGIAVGLVFMAVISVIARKRRRGADEAIPVRMRLPRSLRSLVMTIVFLIILIATSLFVFKNPSIKDELFLKDWSGQIRRQMWEETWAMIKTQPLLGAGLASYQTAVAPFHKDKNIEIFLYPHNWIFNFWAETGLAGLLAFILLIINFFRLGFKKLLATNYSLLTISIMASMVVILVHGFVDVPYFKNDLAILFWLIYVLMV